MPKAIYLHISRLLLAALISACGPIGQSSDEGDAARVQEQEELKSSGNSSNAEGESEGALNIALGNSVAKKPTSDGCTADLIQDAMINPKDGKIRAMYSARMPKFASCAGTENSAVLYLSTDADFNIEKQILNAAQYGCNVIGGKFNIRCNGPEVKINPTGFFQITILGRDEQPLDPDSVKMRMTYESRVK